MTKVFERVLVAAAEKDHFFDLSWDEQVRWMVERAYQIGQADQLGAQVTPAETMQMPGTSVRSRRGGQRKAITQT